MTEGQTAQDRLRAPLIAKLGRFVDLTDRERSYLANAQREFSTVRAGADIVTAGQRYRGIYVLNGGLAFRYKILRDGRRQVLNLVLPGDFIGFPGALFEPSLYSISGLGETVVCFISFREIFDLFRRHPRLGGAFFWLVGHEAALFAEHLVGVGRRTAYERVAHLLLEFLVRLQVAGLADERSYVMPMTQELMADSLGLSVPHVNRTLRRLREDGLIAIEGAQLTCLDIPALSQVAEFTSLSLAHQRIPDL
jgi:CRP-like cAMP-binding protein